MSDIKNYGNLVSGKWITNKNTIKITDKYTNEIFAEVSNADKNLIKKAISNAYETFSKQKLMVMERYSILMKAAEIFKSRKEDIASTISREAGKTITDARAEVERGVQTFIASAEEAKQITGQGLPIQSMEGNDSKTAFTLRVPVGVVCAITPFNFPFNLTAHKIGPAIAAGNAVVLKPAEKTPVTAIKMAEVLLDAGLPGGYLNLVNGFGDEVGPILMSDERVAMYSFTGSPTIGKLIKNNTGIRKVALELGNNSPNIIHHDVKDLDRAVELVVNKGFSNSGQACISVQRIYVHEKIYAEVLNKAKEVSETLVVGNPLHDETDIGPMISLKEAERIEEWVTDAVSDGAEIITGGKRVGSFFYPTILKNVNEDMKVMCEEVFAPVVSIVPYNDLDEVFKIVNTSRFGLQAGIFTSDLEVAMQAAHELEFGGVNINDVSTFRADILPYGGVKNSGIGKEGPKATIFEMTDEKVVTIHI